MFSFTAAANDTSRRTDPVADLYRGPYVPGPIVPSVIFNAYNVYPFANWNEVRLTLLSPVSHSSSWKTSCMFFILLVCEIRVIALARPGRAIALQLDAVHVKILEIERGFLEVTRKIGNAHQTNYY